MTIRTEVEVAGIDVGLTVRPLAMLYDDPTIRIGPDGFARATLTPDGPAAITVHWRSGDVVARVETCGEGAQWLSDRAPGLLGCLDDPTTFDPPRGVVRDLWRTFSGDRVCRTATVWHDLAWTVVQQLVTRAQAAANWRALVSALGQPAPGIPNLRTPPLPDLLARSSIAYLQSLGLDGSRARTLIEAGRVGQRLQRLLAAPADEAARKLSSIRGIGPWTTSCLSAFTWGDPDTVIVGDAGIPSLVASGLMGERKANDSRMLELLDPYRPHRYRVLRLIFAARSRAYGQRS